MTRALCPTPLGRVCYAHGCPTHRGLGWSLLPVRAVRIVALVWPDHDLDEAHLGAEFHPRDGEPIHVEALTGDPGRYFVHDGRHRAIRARNRGQDIIPARVID